jgi:hypothetical protein
LREKKTDTTNIDREAKSGSSDAPTKQRESKRKEESEGKTRDKREGEGKEKAEPWFDPRH